MNYQHTDIEGNPIDLYLSKIVCVGANYADHIKEMNSVTNDEAVFFIKPSTSAAYLSPSFSIPTDELLNSSIGECHNELEISVLIKNVLSKPTRPISSDSISDYIWGIGLGLDLTLRQKQKTLKQLGRPWERAKGFDGACPLSPFIPLSELETLDDIHFKLLVNGEIRQQSHSQFMLHSIRQLLFEIAQVFTLLPGDVVMTGTPSGVAALKRGDKLELVLTHLSGLDTPNVSNTHTFETSVHTSAHTTSKQSTTKIVNNDDK